MTHQGLVTDKASHTVNKGDAELGIRVNLANRLHHLWNNNGTWFVHYTVYPNAITAKRIRRSLKTKSLEQAIQRRDAILGKAEVHSEEIRQTVKFAGYIAAGI